MVKKGYIGPLGDDFPALFPILLGLTLFFGAVTLTYQVYEAKNSQVNSMRANVMLSRGIREQTHMTWDYWDSQACPLLLTTRANYGVKAAMRIDQSVYTTYNKDSNAPFANEVSDNPFFFEEGVGLHKPAVCLETGTLFTDWDSEVPRAEATQRRNFISMSYPVLVDVYNGPNKQVLTAQLTVVTWT